MRGQLSVPGSGRRLVIWRPRPPLALPAPPGHVPQLIETPAPRRSRLGTVWAVFGAAVLGFFGASTLIPAANEPSAGAVIGRSFVDGDGSWRFADTTLREFRESLARLILPAPPAPPPAPAPAPVVAEITLPPDVRNVEPAAGGTRQAIGDDTTASLARLAETLDRPVVDVGPFGEPLPPGGPAPAPQATWSGGIAGPDGEQPPTLVTPLEAQLSGLLASVGAGAPAVVARDAGTDGPAEPAQPRAAQTRPARSAEPRLLNPTQPVAPPPRRPAAATDGAGARVVELPQLPEARHVAVARPVPPPDGFATQISTTSAVARQAAGSAAWMRYARPFEAGDVRPRIAVVITDLGLAQGITDQAIHYLPGAITLSFNPYADNLAKWVEQARRAGHEVLINLPLETGGGPRQAPASGVQVAASLSGAEAAGRLEWALGRATGYVGVASFLGAGATGDDQVLRPILTVLRDRGFIFVGRQAGARTPSARLAQELGVPHAAIDRQIDADPTREAIEQRLAELERAARDNGAVVAMLRPHPASFERLAIWHTSLEAKGIALAPITAVLNRQRNR